MNRTRSMTDIANEAGTDKGTVAGLAHGYTIIYDSLFSNLREKPISLLEIGLAIGGPELGFEASRSIVSAPSVKLWHEYFPLGSIWGLDISDFSKYETEWFKFIRVDCGDAARLASIRDNFISGGTEFDIIVDDGSHASYHQQLTFLTLFPTLRPGGFYVIEDLSWVPSAYESTLPRVPRTTAIISQILKHGKVASGGELPLQQWASAVQHIGSILTFDPAYLADLRRHFNVSNNLGGGEPKEAYKATKAIRVARSLKDAWRNFSSESLSPHVARTQLAVIQKKFQ